jgi:hypothetical protein
MKCFSYCLLLTALLILFSCKEKKSSTNKASAPKDTTSYYPLLSFIEEQKNYVDLRDFRITRILKQNNLSKQDIISKETFLSELAIFLKIATDFEKQKKDYTETIFQDLGTDSYTLTYQSTNPSFTTQRIDILLRSQTNTVKQLFIRHFDQRGDTNFIKQLSFWADKKMEIATEYTVGSNKPVRESKRIEWAKATDK